MSAGSAMTGRTSRGIAVLGMHRSGTSTLAGTLRAAGVHFGDVLDKGSKMNPKGLNEAPSILFMQQNLLEASGGDWHQPPAEVTWQRLHKAVRDFFIQVAGLSADLGVQGPSHPADAGRLVCRDTGPRLCGDLQTSGGGRNVASSTQRVPITKCFEIWRIYNEELLRHWRRRGFPLVEFVSDPGRMTNAFERLLDRLELAATSEASAFYDRDLKHHVKPDLKVPEAASILYRQLQDAAM